MKEGRFDHKPSIREFNRGVLQEGGVGPIEGKITGDYAGECFGRTGR